MNAVILAGGQGTRLWPMSRKDKPKQFFSVLSDAPLVVETYQRLLQLFPPENIYIATLQGFIPQIQELFPELSEKQFLIEPSKRDSGPAMALAALSLQQRQKGDEPFIFIPTDHYIADSQRFLDIINAGLKLVASTGKLLDIGVLPEFASTTLGYTHIGEKQATEYPVEVFTFLGHKEKPGHEEAKAYLESGHYLWHANYYMWTPDKLLQAYQKHAPEIYRRLQEIDQHPERLREIYDDMPSVSIDYAVTEKIDPNDVLILKGDFGWSDIGAWDVLQDRLKHKEADEFQNVIRGKVVHIDTTNSLIYASEKKMIATLGVSDLVIVDTDDALLICPKGRAQEVKKIIQRLESSDFNDYL